MLDQNLCFLHGTERRVHQSFGFSDKFVDNFLAQWCRRTFLIAGGILVVFVVVNGISYLNVMEEACGKNESGKFEV